MNTKNITVNLVKAADYICLFVLAAGLVGVLSFSGAPVRAVIGSEIGSAATGLMLTVSAVSAAGLLAARAGLSVLRK